jgi:hypothetical protein
MNASPLPVLDTSISNILLFKNGSNVVSSSCTILPVSSLWLIRQPRLLAGPYTLVMPIAPWVIMDPVICFLPSSFHCVLCWNACFCLYGTLLAFEEGVSTQLFVTDICISRECMHDPRATEFDAEESRMCIVILLD